MKSIILVALFIATAMAAPSEVLQVVPVEVDVLPAAVSKATTKAAAIMARRQMPALNHEEIHDEFGQYALRYVTAEGTIVSETGRLVPSGDGHVLVVDGEVTYIGDDGRTYTTKYSSGLDGYHAEGSHLPVPPEPLPVQ